MIRTERTSAAPSSEYSDSRDAALVLDVSGVTVRYNGQPALDDISFQLFAGERLAVVGPNGAGKSTLFKVIAGILRAATGTVRFAQQTGGSAPAVAYVPQRSQVDWTFPVNVADVVMMGRTGAIGFLRRPSAHDRRRVRECLDIVGMDKLAHRQIGELSGGQQQRVFIARALAQEAEVMLMDEPLTGLDVTSQDDIFRILDDLRARAVTVLISTHDLNQAAEHFDRVMLLNHQLLGFGAPDEVFTPERLAAAYGGSVRLIPTDSGVIVLGDTHCGHGRNGQ
jgi:ABC-type Mn2+/Zn2+ transport system ATPase subunit